MKMNRAAKVIIGLLLGAGTAFGGGPLYVGGPTFGGDGKVLTWDPAKMPIQYRVDPGPMASSANGSVVIDHAAGVQRIQNMLAVWQGIPNAAISFSNAGPITAVGSYTGGDVSTVAQYNDVVGSCKAGSQNPIIFDANGSLMKALGVPDEVIGYTNICAVDGAAGHITAAMITLNGKMQDGVDADNATPPNYELTANQFDESITHEFGHFIGLDHSQINLDLLTQGAYPCDLDKLAGMPLMFPIEFCQAKKDAGLTLLAPDDMAWVSKMYPGPSQNTAYGVISGRIYFSDGTSQYEGLNVIARAVDNQSTSQNESRRIAVSVISGFLFTGNPGQSVTADMADSLEHNTGGSKYGSRNVQLIGYYEIPVPPGTYTVEVEPVFSPFTGGSGMGPMLENPRVDSGEYWNIYESPFDYPEERDTIDIKGGDKADGIDIILNYTPGTYDDNEDWGAAWIVPILPTDETRTAVGQ
jgi:hypothetical protein